MSSCCIEIKFLREPIKCKLSCSVKTARFPHCIVNSFLKNEGIESSDSLGWFISEQRYKKVNFANYNSEVANQSVWLKNTNREQVILPKSHRNPERVDMPADSLGVVRDGQHQQALSLLAHIKKKSGSLRLFRDPAAESRAREGGLRSGCREEIHSSTL